MTETAHPLASIQSLERLSPPLLDMISREALYREYEAGEVVFAEADECIGMYVVQAGWLKAAKLSAEGREQVMRVVGPGETFNEMAVFSAGRNMVTVTALETAAVWIVPRSSLVRLVRECPELAEAIIHNLAERVQHLMTLVEDLSLRPIEARQARLILERALDGTVQRRRWSTQAEMAARLGTVPDVLQRVLRGLADEGLVAVDRRQIRILDRERLAAKAKLNA